MIGSRAEKIETKRWFSEAATKDLWKATSASMPSSLVSTIRSSSDELLEQVRLLVAALRRAEAGEGPGTVSIADP